VTRGKSRRKGEWRMLNECQVSPGTNDEHIFLRKEKAERGEEKKKRRVVARASGCSQEGGGGGAPREKTGKAKGITAGGKDTIGGKKSHLLAIKLLNGERFPFKGGVLKKKKS